MLELWVLRRAELGWVQERLSCTESGNRSDCVHEEHNVIAITIALNRASETRVDQTTFPPTCVAEALHM
jgi:hypothetical protein